MANPVQRVLPRVTYRDPAGAVDMLRDAFGFTEDADARVLNAEGNISLTEMHLGDAMIMVGLSGNHGQRSPSEADGVNTQMLIVYVDDVDAHHARTVDAGLDITIALSDAPWGDRRYEAVDAEGHRWGFHQRMV